MPQHRLVGNGKTDAGAAAGSIPGLRNPEKRFQNMRQRVFRHAGAMITDPDERFSLLA